jgi:predicted nucleic acid-binding protein
VILIDTSSWIEALRRTGSESVRTRVRVLVESGAAAWCGMVRLELWAGVGDERERQRLREFEEQIPELEINDAVWKKAFVLAGRCRKSGKTAPASDILIAACAQHHAVRMEAIDTHFDFLMKL